MALPRTAGGRRRAARRAPFVPGGPLSDRVFDGAAPRAQARLDGLGSSTAFGSTVYPDELVLNVPGIAAGASKIDVPAYPAIAFSSYPTQPVSESDDAAAWMRAESAADTSTGRARIGAAGAFANGLDTTAQVTHASSGALRSVSQASVDAFRAGPLTIGRVLATASASRVPGSELTTESSAVFSAVKVNDTAVTLDRNGLSGGEAVRAQLARNGVGVRWFDPVETPTGVTSGGVEVSVTLPVTLTSSGTSTVTFTLGRVSAGIAAAPGAPVPDLGVGCCDVAPAGAAAGDGAGGGLPSMSAGPSIAALEGATTGPGTLEQVIPVAATGTAPRVLAETWPVDAYVLFVGAAGLLAVLALALRSGGMRSPWTS